MFKNIKEHLTFKTKSKKKSKCRLQKECQNGNVSNKASSSNLQKKPSKPPKIKAVDRAKLFNKLSDEAEFKHSLSSTRKMSDDNINKYKGFGFNMDYLIKLREAKSISSQEMFLNIHHKSVSRELKEKLSTRETNLKTNSSKTALSKAKELDKMDLNSGQFPNIIDYGDKLNNIIKKENDILLESINKTKNTKTNKETDKKESEIYLVDIEKEESYENYKDSVISSSTLQQFSENINIIQTTNLKPNEISDNDNPNFENATMISHQSSYKFTSKIIKHIINQMSMNVDINYKTKGKLSSKKSSEKKLKKSSTSAENRKIIEEKSKDWKQNILNENLNEKFQINDLKDKEKFEKYDAEMLQSMLEFIDGYKNKIISSKNDEKLSSEIIKKSPYSITNPVKTEDENVGEKFIIDEKTLNKNIQNTEFERHSETKFGNSNEIGENNIKILPLDKLSRESENNFKDELVKKSHENEENFPKSNINENIISLNESFINKEKIYENFRKSDIEMYSNNEIKKMCDAIIKENVEIDMDKLSLKNVSIKSESDIKDEVESNFLLSENIFNQNEIIETSEENKNEIVPLDNVKKISSEHLCSETVLKNEIENKLIENEKLEKINMEITSENKEGSLQKDKEEIIKTELEHRNVEKVENVPSDKQYFLEVNEVPFPKSISNNERKSIQENLLVEWFENEIKYESELKDKKFSNEISKKESLQNINLKDSYKKHSQNEFHDNDNRAKKEVSNNKENDLDQILLLSNQDPRSIKVLDTHDNVAVNDNDLKLNEIKEKELALNTDKDLSSLKMIDIIESLKEHIEHKLSKEKQSSSETKLTKNIIPENAEIVYIKKEVDGQITKEIKIKDLSLTEIDKNLDNLQFVEMHEEKQHESILENSLKEQTKIQSQVKKYDELNQEESTLSVKEVENKNESVNAINKVNLKSNPSEDILPEKELKEKLSSEINKKNNTYNSYIKETLISENGNDNFEKEENNEKPSDMKNSKDKSISFINPISVNMVRENIPLINISLLSGVSSERIVISHLSNNKISTVKGHSEGLLMNITVDEEGKVTMESVETLNCDPDKKQELNEEMECEIAKEKVSAKNYVIKESSLKDILEIKKELINDEQKEKSIETNTKVMKSTSLIDKSLITCENADMLLKSQPKPSLDVKHCSVINNTLTDEYDGKNESIKNSKNEEEITNKNSKKQISEISNISVNKEVRKESAISENKRNSVKENSIKNTSFTKELSKDSNCQKTNSIHSKYIEIQQEKDEIFLNNRNSTNKIISLMQEQNLKNKCDSTSHPSLKYSTTTSADQIESKKDNLIPKKSLSNLSEKNVILKEKESNMQPDMIKKLTSGSLLNQKDLNKKDELKEKQLKKENSNELKVNEMIFFEDKYKISTEELIYPNKIDNLLAKDEKFNEKNKSRKYNTSSTLGYDNSEDIYDHNNEQSGLLLTQILEDNESREMSFINQEIFKKEESLKRIHSSLKVESKPLSIVEALEINLEKDKSAKESVKLESMKDDEIYIENTSKKNIPPSTSYLNKTDISLISATGLKETLFSRVLSNDINSVKFNSEKLVIDLIIDTKNKMSAASNNEKVIDIERKITNEENIDKIFIEPKNVHLENNETEKINISMKSQQDYTHEKEQMSMTTNFDKNSFKNQRLIEIDSESHLLDETSNSQYGEQLRSKNSIVNNGLDSIKETSNYIIMDNIDITQNEHANSQNLLNNEILYSEKEINIIEEYTLQLKGNEFKKNSETDTNMPPVRNNKSSIIKGASGVIKDPFNTEHIQVSISSHEKSEEPSLVQNRLSKNKNIPISEILQTNNEKESIIEKNKTSHDSLQIINKLPSVNKGIENCDDSIRDLCNAAHQWSEEKLIETTNVTKNLLYDSESFFQNNEQSSLKRPFSNNESKRSQIKDRNEYGEIIEILKMSDREFEELKNTNILISENNEKSEQNIEIKQNKEKLETNEEKSLSTTAITSTAEKVQLTIVPVTNKCLQISKDEGNKYFKALLINIDKKNITLLNISLLSAVGTERILISHIVTNDDNMDETSSQEILMNVKVDESGKIMVESINEVDCGTIEKETSIMKEQYLNNIQKISLKNSDQNDKNESVIKDLTERKSINKTSINQQSLKEIEKSLNVPIENEEINQNKKSVTLNQNDLQIYNDFGNETNKEKEKEIIFNNEPENERKSINKQKSIKNEDPSNLNLEELQIQKNVSKNTTNSLNDKLIKDNILNVKKSTSVLRTVDIENENQKPKQKSIKKISELEIFKNDEYRPTLKDSEIIKTKSKISAIKDMITVNQNLINIDEQVLLTSQKENSKKFNDINLKNKVTEPSFELLETEKSELNNKANSQFLKKSLSQKVIELKNKQPLKETDTCSHELLQNEENNEELVKQETKDITSKISEQNICLENKASHENKRVSSNNKLEIEKENSIQKIPINENQREPSYKNNAIYEKEVINEENKEKIVEHETKKLTSKGSEQNVYFENKVSQEDKCVSLDKKLEIEKENSKQKNLINENERESSFQNDTINVKEMINEENDDNETKLLTISDKPQNLHIWKEETIKSFKAIPEHVYLNESPSVNISVVTSMSSTSVSTKIYTAKDQSEILSTNILIKEQKRNIKESKKKFKDTVVKEKYVDQITIVLGNVVPEIYVNIGTSHSSAIKDITKEEFKDTTDI